MGIGVKDSLILEACLIDLRQFDLLTDKFDRTKSCIEKNSYACRLQKYFVCVLRYLLFSSCMSIIFHSISLFTYTWIRVNVFSIK